MGPNGYKFLADALVVFHLTFVAFVIVGAALVLRWRRVAWAHVPAVLWVIYVETSGAICPLTPLENHLRESAGEAGYQGGFVDHYLMPVLYPDGLTPSAQYVIAAAILLVNGTCYGILLARWIRARRSLRAAVPADPVTTAL